MYSKVTARLVYQNKTKKGSSLDKLLSESFGYVTCSVLNTVQFISEQNSLSFTTLEREGYADRTAPLCPLSWRHTEESYWMCVRSWCRAISEMPHYEIVPGDRKMSPCVGTGPACTFLDLHWRCCYCCNSRHDAAVWRLDGLRARLFVGRSWKLWLASSGHNWLTDWLNDWLTNQPIN